MGALKTDGRRKSWNREGKGPDGQSRPIEYLCERDLTILQTLEKYPILDIDHLFAICGGKSSTRFSERLRLLSDPPNEYIFWPKQQLRRANAYMKHGLWQRCRKGTNELKKRGLPTNDNRHAEYNALFEHQYLTYATLASIQIGGADLTLKHLEPLEVSI